MLPKFGAKLLNINYKSNPIWIITHIIMTSKQQMR